MVVTWTMRDPPADGRRRPPFARALAVLLAVLLSTSAAGAGLAAADVEPTSFDAGTVDGTVVDRDGTPLPGTAVYAERFTVSVERGPDYRVTLEPTDSDGDGRTARDPDELDADDDEFRVRLYEAGSDAPVAESNATAGALAAYDLGAAFPRLDDAGTYRLFDRPRPGDGGYRLTVPVGDDPSSFDLRTVKLIDPFRGRFTASSGDVDANGTSVDQVIPVQVAPAEFEVADAGFPDRVDGNGSLAVAATVRNDGFTLSRKPVSLRLDADGDGRLEADETLASRNVTLGPGEETEATLSGDLPSLGAGSYLVGVVTPDASVTGSVRYGADGPRVRVRSVDAPSSATVGERVTVSARVANEGTARAPDALVELFVDADGDGTADPGERRASRRVDVNVDGSRTVRFPLDTGTLQAGRTTLLVRAGGDTRAATLDLEPDSRTTVSVGSATVGADGTARLAVTADELPTGVQGYQLEFTVENASVASVASVTGPVSNFRITDRSGSSVSVAAVDFGGAIGPGATDATLATLVLNRTSVGATDVDVRVVEFIDDDGVTRTPATSAGRLVVAGDPVPVEASADVDEVVVGSTANVSLRLGEAPSAGVGGYELVVRTTNASVLAVSNASVPDATLSSVDVSEDGERATVRAVLPAGDGLDLATVRLTAAREGEAALAVERLQVNDDDGGTYATTVPDPVPVRVVGAPSGPAGPGPIPPATAPPTDPDGDGAYEDVNGDGAVGIGDVIVLFNGLSSPAVADHPDAFDFNGDGSVGIGDVVALFDELD
jgi:hypothetical protein